MNNEQNPKLKWTGRVISGLISALLTMSGVFKCLKGEDVVKGFEHLQIPAHLMCTIGVLEIACVVVYVIPQTAILGAILLTGYMGGAILTHLRMGEPVYQQAIFGVVVWLGIYLREPRLRALLPLRK